MSDDVWPDVPDDEVSDPGIDVLAGLYPSVDRLRATARLGDDQAQRRIRELEDNYAALSKRLDEWRAVADAQRERADRLDERRHEIHELLRHRETENEWLETIWRDLYPYMSHKATCELWATSGEGPCTCGFENALRPLEQLDQREAT